MPLQEADDICRALSGEVLLVAFDRRDENLLRGDEKRYGIYHGTPHLARVFPAYEDIIGRHGFMALTRE
jgi:hypothetical protein